MSSLPPVLKGFVAVQVFRERTEAKATVLDILKVLAAAVGIVSMVIKIMVKVRVYSMARV